VTEYSVDTSDLEAMATTFASASAQVAALGAMLAAGASAPDSASVIGSAAPKYSRILDDWNRNMEQIGSSLETLSKLMAAAASAYAQTETDNTVEP
jgi:WXG100 family type VII secretion target